MSRIDKRRPRRQIVTWLPDDYQITLEQIGHEAWRLDEHDGIEVRSSTDFTNPDEAQQAYIDAQAHYLQVIAAYTLAPLPKKPSEIITIEDDVTV